MAAHEPETLASAAIRSAVETHLANLPVGERQQAIADGVRILMEAGASVKNGNLVFDVAKVWEAGLGK